MLAYGNRNEMSFLNAPNMIKVKSIIRVIFQSTKLVETVFKKYSKLNA